jgi:hypothetical protein
MWVKSLKHGLLIILKVLCIAVLLFTSYLGLVEFFFISLLIILTLLFTLLTYRIANWPDFHFQVLMLFYAAPIYELLLTICWDILQSFFMKIQGKKPEDCDAVAPLFPEV